MSQLEYRLGVSGIHFVFDRRLFFARIPSLNDLETIEELLYQSESVLEQQLQVLKVLLDESQESVGELTWQECKYIYKTLQNELQFSVTKDEGGVWFTLLGTKWTIDDLLMAILSLQGGKHRGDTEYLSKMPLDKLEARMDCFVRWNEMANTKTSQA